MHDIITQPFAKPRSKIDFHETDIGRKVFTKECDKDSLSKRRCWSQLTMINPISIQTSSLLHYSNRFNGRPFQYSKGGTPT